MTNRPLARNPQRSISAVTRSRNTSSSSGLNLLKIGMMKVGAIQITNSW